MNKILTISIAAYNSEKYIQKTLDSLVVDNLIDQLEVFIIDDGGNDSTLDIAKPYNERFPETFIPVHKENGGYGSTVNYSIKRATGKYFKLLDGDDWFDSEELIKLLKLLASVEADAIVTNYYECYESGIIKTISSHNEPDGAIIDIRNGYATKKPFNMWALTYKTSVLKDCGFELPEHQLYTDRIYATIPFSRINSLFFSDISVYCYRLGLEEQSMSVQSQIKHLDDRMDGSLVLCKFYAEQSRLNNERCSYLKNRVTACHLTTASVFRFMPKTKKTASLLRAYESKVSMISKEIIGNEKRMSKFGLFMFFCRHTNYLMYWATPDSIMKNYNNSNG